jgi:hypothetical protein
MNMKPILHSDYISNRHVDKCTLFIGQIVLARVGSHKQFSGANMRKHKVFSQFIFRFWEIGGHNQ